LRAAFANISIAQTMADESLTSRTDAKIRYAKLHIKELRECNIPGRGHDFERAHQEAFFAQLFGAYAALFQELNEDLACGLKPESVSLGQMYSVMKSKGAVSAKLTGLHNLEQDSTTWFSHAKTMRDHVTHIRGIPLTFYEGGPNHGITSFTHPKTLVEVPGNYLDNLEQWVIAMEALIERMRKSE
jgi:hypothetical protein